MAGPARGPVMTGIDGLVLTAVERERLAHPRVGGVILFARNYAMRDQLIELVRSIRALRNPPLLVAVDHEGGRVQRFRDGFTAIPEMRSLGERWDRDVAAAAGEAWQCGATIGRELRGVGIDFSFTPVLDLDHGSSEVIGRRAFHSNPSAAAHLAFALRAGLRAAGMAAVGKHFPGHGHAAADSHVETPVDPRPMSAIAAADLVPFAAQIGDGIEGIMPAHVVYPEIDAEPAGYSARWLREILRGRLRFDGLIFSDDLGMAGAAGAGDIVARAAKAHAAGCNMMIVGNDPEGVDRILDVWRAPIDPQSARRIAAMEGRAGVASA